MSKKLRLVSLLLVLVLTLSLAACGKPAEQAAPEGDESENESPQQEKIVWKFGYLANEQHIWHKTAQEFARLVNEKTDGRLEIKLYPNEQLGSEMDTLNMIRDGSADMTISGESMQNWAPKAALIATPYAFKNMDHMVKVIEGDLGKEISDQIIEKVGVTPIYYHLRSPRNLTSNKPIRNLNDLKGFTMRVPNVPVFLEAWKVAGAHPQAMAFSEVFTALQQNVIDGQENPYDLILSGGLYEVQKYVNETEHVLGWIYVVVGNKQLNSLPDDMKEAVLEAAEEAQAIGEELFQADTEMCKQQLIDKGMEIITDVNKQEFIDAMVPAVKNFLDDEQKDLYERIMSID
ncbi:MAG: TRAP transporter substrate-binding protein [Tepidanaerobacteraceae bacterium]|jgi:tripartite ATP-independent transporter DctP family solute receptor|nr:TRAP transporter substrate-binding protein [Thermoanaerobacterales bacterium]